MPKLFSSDFVDLLAQIPTADSNLYKKLPVVMYDTDPGWISSGFSTFDYYFGSRDTQNKTYTSVRILIRLFAHKRLLPSCNGKPAHYAAPALLELSQILANVAKTVSSEDSRFTRYTDYQNVLEELQTYNTNLQANGYTLREYNK